MYLNRLFGPLPEVVFYVVLFVTEAFFLSFYVYYPEDEHEYAVILVCKEIEKKCELKLIAS